MIAQTITLIVFALLVITIATEKINRAIVSLLGGIILFIFLLFYTQDIQNLFSFPLRIDFENVKNLSLMCLDISFPQKILLLLFQNRYLTPFQFSNLAEFLIGTEADNYNNIRSIILILGIMIQVEILNDAGVFQFIALNLIKSSKGDPKKLLLICCVLSVLLSSILNNILTILLLIPLTIMICRILRVNPIPYILSEAILVNIGGIMFLISSVPNVLISQSAGLSFIDYLINVAWLAIILLIITFLIFCRYFKKRLKVPEKKLIQVLNEINSWSFVPDRPLFYKSIISLIATFIFIILIPDFPGIVAITIGLFLIIISKLKAEQFIKKINFELILYLLGIFIITGCLGYVGVIDSLGFTLKNLT